jgi:hypothetical protein
VSLSNGDFVVLQAAHWKGNPQSQVPCTASEYFQQVFQYAGTNLSTLDSLVSADLHNQFCVIRGQDGSQVTDFILDSSAPGKIQLDTGVVAFSTYDAASVFLLCTVNGDGTSAVAQQCPDPGAERDSG